jgi:hypothetical protein
MRTVATSPTRTASPLRWITAMARTSSRLRMRLRLRTSRDSSPLAEAAGAVVAVVGARGRPAACCRRHPARCQRRHIGHHLKRCTTPPRLFTSATPGHGAQRRADHGPVEQGAPLGEAEHRPSMVNMNISPSGVVIGARPPGALRQVAHHADRRSLTCWRAQ